MISRSIGHREGLLILPRMAGRSTPMMGIDRSNLSCRTLLFLFVLLGAPMAARSATLEDSAKELARKIAASLPVHDNVMIDIRNISSLTPGEARRVEQALNMELQNHGVRPPSVGSAAINVRITLSENEKSYVWSAEIRQGDTSQVVFLPVPRPAESRAVLNSMPIVLGSEKFWEGSERILDAAMVSNSAGESLLLVLLPEGLEFHTTASDSMSKVEIPSGQTATRDARGVFVQHGNDIVILLEPKICTVELDTRVLAGCLSTGGPAGARDPMEEFMPFHPLPPVIGNQVAMLPSGCGVSDQFLATGARDYTEPDSLQIFEGKRSNAVSNPLNFPGPVTALHVTDHVPTAIVRNLQTGNYEAYRLSISCAQ
jgi:hypothetical protein